jgi:RAQPRD family integrative conjugative element protein
MKLSMMSVLVLLAWLIANPAQADNDGDKTVVTSLDDENASLMRLLHEIDALKPLVNEAEGKALVDSRIRLNYSWLRRDLDLIKDGIEWHINTPSTEPRSFEPLKGDYRY